MHTEPTLQSIQLYWIVSATFGLVQSWVIDIWDARRKKSLQVQQTPNVSAPSPKVPPSIAMVTRKGARSRK